MALYETVTCNGKENAQKQRRRNIQYLILNYLREEGHSETANTFITEARLSNEYQVCDNIDLDIILQDFSSYYLLKFNKQPLICKKISETEKKNLNNTQTSSTAQKKRDKIKLNKDVGKHEVENLEEKPFFTVTPLINQGPDNILDNKKNIVEVTNVEVIKPITNFIKTMSLEQKEIAEYIFSSTKFSYGSVSWDDIAGLDNAKTHLREATIYPLKYPRTFEGLLSPWSGILLFGPPGGGKTLLVKALAQEFSGKIFNISASIIVSKWRGESEKYIKVLFDLARYCSPSVIFMDEFEALTSKRDSSNEHEASRRLKHELLIELDGLCRTSDNVLFLAVTNLPWEVDPAVLRRLEKRLYVPLPNKECREKIFQLFLQDSKCNMSPVNYKILAEKTEGYSGSDIKVICKEAAMASVRKYIVGDLQNKQIYIIEQQDLEQSIGKIKPTAKDLVSKYNTWANTLGAE